MSKVRQCPERVNGSKNRIQNKTKKKKMKKTTMMERIQLTRLKALKV